MTRAAIELKIQSLLKSTLNPQTTLDVVVDELENKLNWTHLQQRDIESLCLFFLKIGYVGHLARILSEKGKTLVPFPWPYFTEALFQASSVIQDEVKEAILKGAADTNSMDELARSRMMDHFEESLPSLRDARRRQFKFRLQQERLELLSQAEVMGSQGLYAEEEKLLQKLLRLMPGDSEGYDRLLRCRKKKALELFGRRTQIKGRPRPLEKKVAGEAEILSAVAASQQEVLQQDPELAMDFAISHWMWDNPAQGLIFLENEEPSPPRDWLRLELLLKARHFVEVMRESKVLEERYVDDPETVWAVIYYRAQALWGLGDKYQALEHLESLCAAQPDYRSAAVLLAEMKEDLE